MISIHEKAREGFLGFSDEKEDERGFTPWKLRPRYRGFSPRLLGGIKEIDGISKPQKRFHSNKSIHKNNFRMISSYQSKKLNPSILL